VKIDLTKCPACQHEKHTGNVCKVVVDNLLAGGSYPAMNKLCGCTDANARKADTGKREGFSLLPWDVITGLAAVYAYGRKKYAANSWQTVPPDAQGRTAEERYEEAMFRHWSDFKKGEWRDPESGLPHLYHFLWNAVAICWFNDRKAWPPEP
jgi:hypothetical protein